MLKAHTNNSAGEVTLASTNPLDVPKINFRYFDEGNDATNEDLESVVEGVKFIREMAEKANSVINQEILVTPVYMISEKASDVILEDAAPDPT